ncbi:hypothetical protein L915_08434 [Phytophthora nicotianae]|uniref:Uncharacterized protein n=1 Tax=Phytophthora nicotianae TaxID=4792 RepID=W2GVK9_PHYNI|nr:hypothetical protein L915_08434 [Phytophthora nicotianae]
MSRLSMQNAVVLSAGLGGANLSRICFCPGSKDVDDASISNQESTLGYCRKTVHRGH